MDALLAPIVLLGFVGLVGFGVGWSCRHGAVRWSRNPKRDKWIAGGILAVLFMAAGVVGALTVQTEPSGPNDHQDYSLAGLVQLVSLWLGTANAIGVVIGLIDPRTTASIGRSRS
jgi:hypothetical protein